MRERLSKALSLGFLGNIFFVLFGFICYIYYLTYDPDSAGSKALEFTAYLVEFSGFGMLIFSDYLLSVSVRMRRLMKIAYTAYIIVEVVLMIIELNSFTFRSFYDPYSVVLAIVHAVFSGLVCLSFLQLDPSRPRFEAVLVVCIGLIFGGMMGIVMGIRIYFSIIVNAVAFALMFFMIKFMLKNEDIEIDCHGDKARVAEYRSIVYDDKGRKKPSVLADIQEMTPEDKAPAEEKAPVEGASPEEEAPQPPEE
ncbi:MAG: hypothetical protein IJ071_03760 [Ruminococcus sp.]|nr:hypothetical protein [Ruminococcus sp.]